MRKFRALYINEMIKISRKIVVLIILGVMILGVFGFGALMKVSEMSVAMSPSSISDKDQIREEMTNQMNYYKEELAAVEQKIKAASSEEDRLSLATDKIFIEQQIELYQYAADNGINLYSNGYQTELLNSMVTLKSQLGALELTPVEKRTDEQKAQIKTLKQNIDAYSQVLENSDFAGYIKLKNSMIDQDETLSDEEKKLKKETNDLWLKLDPDGTVSSGNNAYMLQSSLMQIENYKRSLLENIDYASNTGNVMPLTPDRRREIENDLAVLEYKAEKGTLNSSYDTQKVIQESAITGMFGFGLFLLVCMMLILAGGAISQEISTGSIKSLIISPTKRYKIFFAKLASLATVGLFGVIFLYGLAIQANGLFFGFGSGSPYLFAVDGHVYELGFALYRFLYLMINFIDVLVYMMMAYMLSILTRNTAASVGISIAVYFGGNLASTFIALFATGEWSKFIPFSNMSLASRIFPDQLTSAGMNILGFRSVVPSTAFSLIYLAVLVLCMGYTALDSFNRRDIK